jgi:hypothetical protein
LLVMAVYGFGQDEDAEDRRCPCSMISLLAEDEARVVALRFGLDGQAPHAPAEVGAMMPSGDPRRGAMGVGRVAEIEAEALSTLRRMMTRPPVCRRAGCGQLAEDAALGLCGRHGAQQAMLRSRLAGA